MEVFAIPMFIDQRDFSKIKDKDAFDFSIETFIHSFEISIYRVCVQEEILCMIHVCN